jgi:formylglycine-generating enzyme required for sulfatase activity
MPTPITRTRFTLFLASPSKDTGPAREAVVQAVQELAQESPFDEQLELCLFRWDDPRKRVVLSLHNGGQRDVNEQAIHPAKVDLLIGLFCHTMGGTLEHDATDGHGQPFGHAVLATQRPWYCSEWEVAQAPDAWVFFAKRDVPEDLLEDALQVNRYRKQCEANKRFYNRFETENELGAQLKTALRTRLKLLLKRPDPEDGNPHPPDLHPDHQALLTHLLAAPLNEAAPLPLVPQALAEKAQAQPARCLRSWLLLRYAEGCGEEAGRLDREFVALTVNLPSRDGPSTPQPFDDLGAALASQTDAPAWVLVGAPGAGKTTLLRHLEMRHALGALHALAADPQATPPLAVWWRLGDYASTPTTWPDPAQWLADSWHHSCPHGPSWQVLHERFPIRLLLDGANEIPAANAAAHETALRHWAAWVHRLRASGWRAPLLSVRRHELALLHNAQLSEARQIEVQPWADARIRQYCAQRQQPALWAHLSQQPRLLDMARNPFNLKHQCEVGGRLGRPAQHRAELLAALLHLRLRTPANAAVLDAPDLLGTDRRDALPSDWPAAPLCLPDEAGLLHALAQGAAQQMHEGTGQSWPERRWATLWPNPAQRRAALKAAQALDVLRNTGRMADPLNPTQAETQWRWSHQLWQEFFAARALRDAVRGEGRLPADWPKHLAAPQPEPVDWEARSTNFDPLPGPGVNAWDECVQLAVAQSAQPLAWLDELQAQGNLALAGRAAALDAQRLRQLPNGPARLAALQTRLRQRSEDAAVDLRQRIEAAELAHELGDERYDVTRDAQGHERWRVPKPERWINVPAGFYTLGSADGDADERGPDGQPLRLWLDAFQMAFAPVTNAEFRCFIEAGGYTDERWWPGEANTWRLGKMDNEAGRRFLINTITRQAEALAAAPNLRPEFKEPLQAAMQEGEEAVAAFAKASALHAYPPPQENPEAFTHPEQWANPLFNHPAQPVAGVCWFEAQAYTLWLGHVTGLPIQLPTEAQWEAAARGLAARRWPWAADETPQRHQINSFEAGVRRPTPVALFTTSHTPEGLADLAGNVWEWTTCADTDSLQAETLHTCASGSAPRAVRGGGWNNPASVARAGCRFRSEPGNRLNSQGFRVVCCSLNFEF